MFKYLSLFIVIAGSLCCNNKPFVLEKNPKFVAFRGIRIDNKQSNFNLATDSSIIDEEAWYKLPKPAPRESEIEIRIWGNPWVRGYPKVFTLKNSAQQWFAEKRMITKADFDKSRLIPLEIKQEKFKRPKSGWNKFLNELFELDILTISDRERQTGDAMDENSFIIEIYTSNKVRRYRSVGGYSTDTEEHKKVGKILKLIEENFNFKWTEDGR